MSHSVNAPDADRSNDVDDRRSPRLIRLPPMTPRPWIGAKWWAVRRTLSAA